MSIEWHICRAYAVYFEFDMFQLYTFNVQHNFQMRKKNRDCRQRLNENMFQTIVTITTYNLTHRQFKSTTGSCHFLPLHNRNEFFHLFMHRNLVEFECIYESKMKPDTLRFDRQTYFRDNYMLVTVFRERWYLSVFFFGMANEWNHLLATINYGHYAALNNIVTAEMGITSLNADLSTKLN